jgi:hypothetical protein
VSGESLRRLLGGKMTHSGTIEWSASHAEPNPLFDGWSLTDFQRGRLRNIGSELRPEFCDVVGEERGLVAGARDGDVGEA